jgi:hypothetical protein
MLQSGTLRGPTGEDQLGTHNFLGDQLGRTNWGHTTFWGHGTIDADFTPPVSSTSAPIPVTKKLSVPRFPPCERPSRNGLVRDVDTTVRRSPDVTRSAPNFTRRLHEVRTISPKLYNRGEHQPSHFDQRPLLRPCDGIELDLVVHDFQRPQDLACQTQGLQFPR